MFASLTEERPAKGLTESPARDGLRVSDLDEGLAGRLGVDPGTKGVVIALVEPGSFAQRAGLRPGDLLIEVNRQPIASVEEFEKAWSPKGTLTLRVRRGDSLLFLALSR